MIWGRYNATFGLKCGRYSGTSPQSTKVGSFDRGAAPGSDGMRGRAWHRSGCNTRITPALQSNILRYMSVPGHTPRSSQTESVQIYVETKQTKQEQKRGCGSNTDDCTIWISFKKLQQRACRPQCFENQMQNEGSRPSAHATLCNPLDTF